MIRALHERSGELSRFVPDLNSNATVESRPGIMRQAVAGRPDGETPSCPAAALEIVYPENFR